MSCLAFREVISGRIEFSSNTGSKAATGLSCMFVFYSHFLTHSFFTHLFDPHPQRWLAWRAHWICLPIEESKAATGLRYISGIRPKWISEDSIKSRPCQSVAKDMLDSSWRKKICSQKFGRLSMQETNFLQNTTILETELPCVLKPGKLTSKHFPFQ